MTPYMIPTLPLFAEFAQSCTPTGKLSKSEQAYDSPEVVRIGQSE